MTLEQFLLTIYPLLANGTMDRIEKELDCGRVTAYRCGTIIRIDIKPR